MKRILIIAAGVALGLCLFVVIGVVASDLMREAELRKFADLLDRQEAASCVEKYR